MNYEDKEQKYYKNVRLDVLSLLPPSSKGFSIGPADMPDKCMVIIVNQ